MPRRESQPLAVLEGRWYDAYNVSVKGPFDLLSDIPHRDCQAHFHNAKRPIEEIEGVCQALLRRQAGLVEKLDFRVYKRNQRTGAVEPVLEPRSEE